MPSAKASTVHDPFYGYEHIRNSHKNKERKDYWVGHCHFTQHVKSTGKMISNKAFWSNFSLAFFALVEPHNRSGRANWGIHYTESDNKSLQDCLKSLNKVKNGSRHFLCQTRTRSFSISAIKLLNFVLLCRSAAKKPFNFLVRSLEGFELVLSNTFYQLWQKKYKLEITWNENDEKKELA